MTAPQTAAGYYHCEAAVVLPVAAEVENNLAREEVDLVRRSRELRSTVRDLVAQNIVHSADSCK